eukprot:4869328-Pleurochrysis_carterae.AAC.2
MHASKGSVSSRSFGQIYLADQAACHWSSKFAVAFVCAQLHGVQHHVPTLPSAALQQPVFSADVAAEAASTTPAARATAAAVDGALGSGTRALARQPGVRAQFRADSVSSPSVDKASAETASRPLRQKQLSSLLQRVEMMREKRRDLSTP